MIKAQILYVFCKRVVRPIRTQAHHIYVLCVFLCFPSASKEQMHRACVLCVFVSFLRVPGHTTNVFHVFLCFFINVNFCHNYNWNKYPMSFKCFCVLFSCTGLGNTNNKFCVFLLCLSSGPRTHNQCVLCVFAFFCLHSSQI